jgi:hypothetical protein
MAGDAVSVQAVHFRADCCHVGGGEEAAHDGVALTVQLFDDVSHALKLRPLPGSSPWRWTLALLARRHASKRKFRYRIIR